MPVTKKSNFISKETNPGCGIDHEKVITISSSPATHRLRTFYKHTAKEEKRKKKKIDMDSEKSQLGFASSNRKKKSYFLCQVHCWLQTFPASFAHLHFERIFLGN